MKVISANSSNSYLWPANGKSQKFHDGTMVPHKKTSVFSKGPWSRLKTFGMDFPLDHGEMKKNAKITFITVGVISEAAY